ncbi:hypothetical protein HK097_007571 [Rhizophlyctis rosea]|uniref:Oxidoreductase n=1 Tax=Rhizophlyctis rosea TaxID=64517 RepID=A0AAD5SN76_9FUNG|nr:hypothetical protein HK097_007571 [Rhizophlyctis rosea]
MTTPIGVGIIGGGFSAITFHAPFITSNPAFALKSFLRTRSEPVKGYESIPVLTSFSEFLADSTISLVVVTSPSHDHYEHTKAVLEAGKHAIVEKPFTATVKEAEELTELAMKKGRVLSVYHNRRWDGDFLTVKDLIKEGKLGRVAEMEIHFDRLRNFSKPNWREGDAAASGVFYDLGSHLIDQSLTLFGTPTSITAHILNERRLPSINSDDSFIAHLHYASNPTSPSHPLTVTVKATMLAAHPRPHYIVLGTTGSYIKHGLDPQENQLKAGLKPIDAGYGVEEESHSGELSVEVTQGGEIKRERVKTLKGRYDFFFDNVAKAVLAGNPDLLEVTAEQATNVIRLIEAAQKSSAERRTIDL